MSYVNEWKVLHCIRKPNEMQNLRPETLKRMLNYWNYESRNAKRKCYALNLFQPLYQSFVRLSVATCILHSRNLQLRTHTTQLGENDSDSWYWIWTDLIHNRKCVQIRSYSIDIWTNVVKFIRMSNRMFWMHMNLS